MDQTKIIRIMISLVICFLVVGIIWDWSKQNNSSLAALDCRGEANQALCWEKLIQEGIHEGGVVRGFELLAKLYTAEPAFAANCHDYAHRLGKSAYDEYSKGQVLPVNESASYCGYGFYHGFMEEMLVSGQKQQAGNFCTQVETRSSKILGDSCFHGLGHGALASVVADYTIWGKKDEIIKRSLAVCSNEIIQSQDFTRCASGVFMELATAMLTRQYELSFNAQDSLEICRTQAEDVKMACYTQLNSVVSASFTSLDSIVEYLKSIPSNYAKELVVTIQGATAKRNAADVAVCRSIDVEFSQDCINGTALAYILKGTPGAIHTETVAFCTGLNPDEKEGCLKFSLKYFQQLYAPEKFEEVCGLIKNEFNVSCINYAQ